MQTVKGLVESFAGQVVLSHRHASYLMNPEGENPSDLVLLAGMNYARVYPDHNNPLDQNGRDASVRQGNDLVNMGACLRQVFISRQGRSPETGLYIAIGVLNASYPTSGRSGLSRIHLDWCCDCCSPATRRFICAPLAERGVSWPL